MIALLKEKAKVDIVHKPRKTYDVANCLKRKRESSFDNSQNQKPKGNQSKSAPQKDGVQIK